MPSFIPVNEWSLRQRPDITTLLQPEHNGPDAPLLFGESTSLALPALRLLVPSGLSVRKVTVARKDEAEFIFVYPSSDSRAQAYAFVLTYRDFKHVRENRIPPASDLWNIFDQPWLDASISDYAFHLACTRQLSFAFVERYVHLPSEPSPLSTFK